MSASGIFHLDLSGCSGITSAVSSLGDVHVLDLKRPNGPIGPPASGIVHVLDLTFLCCPTSGDVHMIDLKLPNGPITPPGDVHVMNISGPVEDPGAGTSLWGTFANYVCMGAFATLMLLHLETSR